MEWFASLISVIAGVYAGVKNFHQWCKKRRFPIPDEREDNGSEILVFIERFIKTFQSHGIERIQIPRILPEKYRINIHDVSTNENLLKALNEEVIDATCDLFGLNRKWIDGKDDVIYPTNSYDKDPNRFIDFISNLKNQYRIIEGFAIKDPKDKLEKNDCRSEIALLFRAKIDDEGKFRESGIYKYFPLSEIYYWGYERTRLQFKAYVLIAWQFDIKIFGLELFEKAISQIRNGLIFPDPLVENVHFISWHPDEYIFTDTESRAVKDGKEALEARKYLSHMGWIEKLVSFTGEIQTPSSGQKKWTQN